jgi:hypothetical protein
VTSTEFGVPRSPPTVLAGEDVKSIPALLLLGRESPDAFGLVEQVPALTTEVLEPDAGVPDDIAALPIRPDAVLHLHPFMLLLPIDVAGISPTLVNPGNAPLVSPTT